MKLSNTIILILATFVLASCTGSPVCFRQDVFCAAQVTNTIGINDNGINQDTWSMLQELKNDGTVDEIAYIESVDARDYEKNIAFFGGNGYDVIITAGIGLRDETLHAADLYPSAVFIGIDQPTEIKHERVIPITFPEDQMGFLAGVLAARLTKTQVAGAVCETSGLPAMWRYCEGFRAGVEYINDEIKVLVAYRDDGSQEKLFLDDEWGAEKARDQISRGADVIFAAGGITGQGALQAASEAGIPAIGAEQNQAAALAETGSGVVTSVYGAAGLEVQKMMRLLKNGEMPQGGTGRFGYVLLSQKFPESLTTELDAVLKSLLDGQITAGIRPERP
jgi:basic membrane protein A